MGHRKFLDSLQMENPRNFVFVLAEFPILGNLTSTVLFFDVKTINDHQKNVERKKQKI